MSTEAVQLIFQIKAENQAVLASLRQAVSGVNSELDKGAKITATLAKSNSDLVVTLKSVSQAEQEVANARKKSNESLGESIAKGILFAEVTQKIISLVKQATVESALYAARTQQLNTVMDQLARVNGLSVTAVRQQADAVKAQGISTQESRETINKMIFAQLDLSKATELARLSQNAAKIAGISSSEALQGIIAGIVEQRVQILRTYGIQVSFEQALIRGAAALHKTKDTLTDYERANIALNEVLSKGPRIAGAYEVSLSTAAGQMQSLKRQVDEARNALGEGFLPILQKVVGFLTDSTHSVQENAEAYQQLALHITSVGLALAAAKLTPGGPVPKAAVGIAVGAAAEYLGATDPVEEAQKYSSEAIAKVEKDRRSLQQKFNNGTIKDKEEYLREDQRLKDLQLTIEQNFTEQIAGIYKKRQQEAKDINEKGPSLAYLAKHSVTQFFDDDYTILHPPIPQIPEKLSLGQGHDVSRKQIEAQIAESNKPFAPIDPNSLKITPDVSAQFDSVLGEFTGKVKEAIKTSQGGLDRAKAGLLNGSDRIEAERAAALSKLAEDFRVFTATFKDTLAKADTIKDPTQRAQLIKSVQEAQAQYGQARANINQQFNLERRKDERDDAVRGIGRDKKLTDNEFEINNRRIREDSENRIKIERATPSAPGHEEQDIERTYKESLAAAKQRREESRQQNEADLSAANAIFKINKDDKALDDARVASRIAFEKADAQFISEKGAAETQKQIQILELRKKQRDEVQLSLDLVRKGAEEEGKINSARTRDASARRVKLGQAQAGLTGNEVYGQNIGFADRVDAAQQEHAQIKASLDEQTRAATQAYITTGNKLELERTIADIRKQAAQSDYELEKAILDVRLDKELQIAEIRKQQDQELRGLLGKLYDDLGKKGRGPKQFFQDILDDFKKQLFVNTGAIVFKGALQQLGGLIPGQQQIDPITGKPTGQLTPLGQILKGTPLGIDPVKLAQAQQISATKDNTRALDDLTGVLTGTPSGTAGTGRVTGGGPASGAGGLGGILGNLGGILQGSNGGLIIKNLTGGGGSTGSGLLGGFGSLFSGGTGISQFLSHSSTASAGANGGIDFSPDLGPFAKGSGINGGSAASQIGAAVAALPSIIGGIQKGGVGGITGAISGALGAAASIPGPQQPFIAGAGIALGLISSLFGKTRYQQWQKNLNNRLASKFQTPSSISLSQDLAGNSVDYDYLGNLRTYQGAPSTNNTGNGITVNVSALDVQSFQTAGPMLADSVRNMIQLGHPLASTIQSLPAGSN